MIVYHLNILSHVRYVSIGCLKGLNLVLYIHSIDIKSRYFIKALLTLEYAILLSCMPPRNIIKLEMTVKISWVYNEPFVKLINDYHLD